jgi:hypothetical protein
MEALEELGGWPVKLGQRVADGFSDEKHVIDRRRPAVHEPADGSRRKAGERGYRHRVLAARDEGIPNVLPQPAPVILGSALEQAADIVDELSPRDAVTQLIHSDEITLI